MGFSASAKGPPDQTFAPLTRGCAGQGDSPTKGDLSDRAVGALVECGFDSVVARQIVRLSPGAASDQAHSPADRSACRRSLAARAEASISLARWCDAEMLVTARSMAVAAGDELLARMEVAGVEQLSSSQARRWRATAKSAVASELNAMSGWGIQNCHDRVGLALAPRAIAERVIGGLRSGWNDSRAVLDYWRKVRCFSVESARQVADRALGPMADGDGQPVRPSRSEFTERLARAVVAVEGAEVTARRRRHERLEDRDASATVDDDGLGTLVATGPAASVASAAMRVDAIARKARSAGDGRSLAQIRSDLALALLIYGSIPSASAEPSEGVRPDEGVGPLVLAALDRHAAPISLEVVVPLSALVDSSSTEVAQVAGVGAISAEHARELAMTPGATIHRLVTDPLDGRCIERSAATYLPDAQMLAQIRAVDRSCRGPGCAREARHCQPDHEVQFAEGGATSESNLSLKHSFHHNNKTLGVWTSELHPDRRVTWTTLFQQRYVTRPYDYLGLDPLGAGSCGAGSCGADPKSADSRGADYLGLDPRGASSQDAMPELSVELVHSRDTSTRDLQIYLALAEQWRAGSLNPMSDEGDAADAAELLTLRHHTPGGAVRSGPSPESIAVLEQRRREMSVDAIPAAAIEADLPPF